MQLTYSKPAWRRLLFFIMYLHFFIDYKKTWQPTLKCIYLKTTYLIMLLLKSHWFIHLFFYSLFPNMNFRERGKLMENYHHLHQPSLLHTQDLVVLVPCGPVKKIIINICTSFYWKKHFKRNEKSILKESKKSIKSQKKV